MMANSEVKCTDPHGGAIIDMHVMITGDNND